MNMFCERLRNLIANNHLDTALLELLFALRDSKVYYNNVIILNSQFNDLKNNEIIGVLDMQSIFQQKARLINSTLQLILNIENEPNLTDELISNIKGRISESKFIIVYDKVFNIQNNQFIFDINDYTLTKLFNELYYMIKEYVKPYTYGEAWIIKNIETNEIIKNSRSLNKKNVTLYEAGLRAGERYRLMKI